MRTFFHRLVMLSALWLMAGSSFAENFAVVVNSGNSFSGGDVQQEIKRLFLKQKKSWGDGTRAKPLGPASSSPAHTAFLGNVLGMSEADLAQHWLRTKQVSGQTPPREVKSAKLALKLVARDAGAFAVVDSATAASLPSGTKVLFTF